MDEIEKWIISEHTRLVIGDELGHISEGQYTIPNLSVESVGDDRLYLMNQIIISLKQQFPDFIFWKTEKMFPTPGEGLTIKWAQKAAGDVTGLDTYRRIIDAGYAQNDKDNLERELEEEHGGGVRQSSLHDGRDVQEEVASVPVPYSSKLELLLRRCKEILTWIRRYGTSTTRLLGKKD